MVQAAEMRVLRRILGKSRMDRLRNVEIIEELKQEGTLRRSEKAN